MKSTLKNLLISAAAIALTAGAALAENVIIGNFGSPTPMQVARAEGKSQRELSCIVQVRLAAHPRNFVLTNLGSLMQAKYSRQLTAPWIRRQQQPGRHLAVDSNVPPQQAPIVCFGIDGELSCAVSQLRQRTHHFLKPFQNHIHTV